MLYAAPMTMPSPEDQARRFQQVRNARRTELQEDYVELVADLIAAQGEARAADLAERLGVSAATVTNMLSKLRTAGLIEMRPYRSIFLTKEGEALAARSRERHRVIVDFLAALGVPFETAETDAEGIEHHVSEATLAAMRGYVARARNPDRSTFSSG